MKKQPVDPIPATQRELGAYVGISGTLMNMAATGRHGTRSLSNEASAKLASLMLAHVQAQQLPTLTPSLKKLKAIEAEVSAAVVKKMKKDLSYTESHITVLKVRLDEMKQKERQDRQWLKTVDLSLSKLLKAKKPAKEYIWFEYQQQKVMKRLKRNGLAGQFALSSKIELEKAKALAYRKVLKEFAKP